MRYTIAIDGMVVNATPYTKVEVDSLLEGADLTNRNLTKNIRSASNKIVDFYLTDDTKHEFEVGNIIDTSLREELKRIIGSSKTYSYRAVRTKFIDGVKVVPKGVDILREYFQIDGIGVTKRAFLRKYYPEIAK